MSIGSIIFWSIVACLCGFYLARRERQVRNEGRKEAGAMLAKLRDEMPEGSYARAAYEFVIDDLQKAAGAAEIEI